MRHGLGIVTLLIFLLAPAQADLPRKIESRQAKAFDDAGDALYKLGRFCVKNRAYDEAREQFELGLELAPEHSKLQKALADLDDEAGEPKKSFAEKYPEECFEAHRECGDELVELIAFLEEEGYHELASIRRSQLEGLFTAVDARFPTLLSPESRELFIGQSREGQEWKLTLCSKYYDFFSNGDAKEVADYAMAMDLMYENYCDIFKYTEMPRAAFPVLLYANQQQFMSATGMGPTTGGFYDGSRIVGFHGGLHGLSVLEVLFHEGTHQFQGLILGQNMWGAQTWFIEGLAVYFEASKIQGKKLKTGQIPRERLNSLKRGLRADAYTSLRDLIRLEQSQFTGYHYAHGWALVYFFVHGAKGGRERFVDYFTRVQNGTYEGVATFEEIFDKPIEEIEAAWKDFVLGLQ